MKSKTISRFLVGSLLTGLSGLASAELFEDFSGPISLTKFWGMEETIQLDTTNEKLILTSKAKAYTAGYRSNNLSMQPHTGVSLLQADISVTEVTLGNANTQNAMLGIAGTYYNANSASTTSELGDVFARIALGDRGNGPEAWYELQVSTDENFFTSTITTGSFGTITLGTAYTASITYDGDNTLTYQFNNGTAVNLDGPPRLGEPGGYWRAIAQNLRFGQLNSTPDLFDEGPDDGTTASISGTVDMVTTEDGLVDEFAEGKIDHPLWNQDQTSVALVDGKLEMRVTGQGDQRTERFWIKQTGLDTFGAKVTLLSSGTVNDTTRVRGRLTHYLSNDTYDVENGDTANGWEGMIWTQLLIERSGGNQRVIAYAERVKDADWSTWDELFWEDLGPINLDQEYDMLIEKTGTLVEYKFDGEVIHSFDLASDHGDILSGNDFEPVHTDEFGIESGLQTRVQDDAGEAHVQFDDIVTDYMPQALTLNAFDQGDEEVEYPDGVVVHEGEVVDLIAKVSDPDDILAYLWEQESGTDVTAARGTTAAKTIGTDQSFSFKVPENSDKETLEFKVTLVDNAGVESNQQFSLKVDNSEISTLAGDDGNKKSGGGGGAFNPLTLLPGLFMLFGFARRRHS